MNNQPPANIDLLSSAARVLEKYGNKILFAYLFGSRANGEETRTSDVDIAVFCAARTREDYFDIKLELHADLCRALKRNDVDIVILNTTTNLMLLDEIIRKGIVFYDHYPESRADFEVKTILETIDFKGHRKAIMGI